MTWQIRLLGQFVVLHNGEPIQDKAWRSRQTRTILKRLLLPAGTIVTTGELLHILWPDQAEDAARRRLHVRLSELRRLFPPEAIITAADGYFWNTAVPLHLDTHAFEELAEQGRQHQEQGEWPAAIAAYEAAAALYTGDLLEEDRYASWVLLERERLRERHLVLLTELAESYAQQGRYRRAIATCRQALSRDPLREALYVRLMLYHYYAGNRPQALQAYDTCQRQLADHLRVEPLPATRQLADQIRRGTVTTAGEYPLPAYNGRLFQVPFSLSRPPLSGRSGEYAWLIDRWQRHTTGIVVLTGAAGMGKSRLADEFIGYARRQQAHVITLTAGANELPYTAVTPLLPATHMPPGLTLPARQRSALQPLLAFPVDGCLPDPAPVTAAATQHEALLLLLRATLPTGVILLLDDAHRLDPPTLALLADLRDHLFILLSARPQPDITAHLRPLLPSASLHTLNLEPLSETAVASLITALSGRDWPTLSQHLYQQTGGSPLYAIAALHHLFESGNLYIDAQGTWVLRRTLPPTLPPTVQRTIETRLAALPAAARQVLDFMALFGGEVDFEPLQQALGWAETAVLDALDILLAAGVVVEPRTTARPEFAIVHQSYTDVAAATLPAVRRRRAHLQIARTLAAGQPEAGYRSHTIAHHFLQGGDDESGHIWLIHAGDAAVRYFAHTAAIGYYRQALTLSPSAAVWEKLGHLTHHLARYAESLGFYRKALERWQAAGDTATQVKALFAIAENHRELSQFEAAREAAAAGLSLAAALPDQPLLAAQGHIILSNALRSGQLAPPAQIASHLETALVLAQPAAAPQLVGEAHFWLGVVAVNHGDAAAALVHDRAALAAFAGNGRSGWLAIAHNNTAYHALLAGNAYFALETAQAGLALARDIEARHVIGWLLSTLGEIQLHLDQLDAAAATLHDGLAHAEKWGPPRLAPGLRHDLARVALAQGDGEAALVFLEAALAQAETDAPQFVPRLLVTLAEVQLWLGNVKAGESAVTRALSLATARQQRHVCGLAWRVRGQLAFHRGDLQCADHAFAHSLHILRALGNPLETARTQAAWLRLVAGSRQQSSGSAQPLLASLRQHIADTFTSCAARLDLRHLPPIPEPLS